MVSARSRSSINMDWIWPEWSCYRILDLTKSANGKRMTVSQYNVLTICIDISDILSSISSCPILSSISSCPYRPLYCYIAIGRWERLFDQSLSLLSLQLSLVPRHGISGYGGWSAVLSMVVLLGISVRSVEKTRCWAMTSSSVTTRRLPIMYGLRSFGWSSLMSAFVADTVPLQCHIHDQCRHRQSAEVDCHAVGNDLSIAVPVAYLI